MLSIKLIVKTNYSYVSQTKRKLKTRLKEHIKDFNKPTNSLSLVYSLVIIDYSLVYMLY